MMTAIIGVALAIDRQTGGLFTGMAAFLLPLPMVFYSVKYGWKNSWMVLAAMCFLAFMLESLPGMLLAGGECLIGMIYGGSIHAKKDSRNVLIRTMAAAVIYDVLTMIVFAGFFGYDLAGEMEEYQRIMNTVFTQSGINVLEGVDLDSYLPTVFVVAAVITGIMEAYVIHVLSRLMMKRLRIQVEPPLPLYDYYPPKWSGYVGILGFVSYYTAMSGRIADASAASIMSGVGMALILYLAFFGMYGVMLGIRMHFPRSRVAPVLIGLLMLFIAMSLLALVGFLYITTDTHKHMMENARRNAAAQRQGAMEEREEEEDGSEDQQTENTNDPADGD